MKLIQYISTTYVREELYNPDNWDLINPKSPPEFISSGGPFVIKWSWRDSNPRPNEEIISFLHAYLCLSFSCRSRTKAINSCLIL